MARIRFSEDAEQVYSELLADTTKSGRMLLRATERVTEVLKDDTHYGQTVAQRLIPKEYRKSGVTNLFRLELPCFWRMLYTIRSDDSGERMVFVLDILNHNEYDKLFGYKKK